jgi:hypothetical protein
MAHLPLSQSLKALLETKSGGSFVLNELLTRTDGRGTYLMMIVLSLPFITPIPLPGVSTVLGGVIIWLAIRQAMGHPARLPAFLGERPLPAGKQQQIMNASVKFLTWLEKLVRPRGGAWLVSRPGRWFHAVLLSFLGFLLVLPFPPFVPFTNSLPAYALIVTAASIMEEDGLVIWLGYVLAALSAAYISLIYGSAIAVFRRYWDTFLQFLGL